MDGFYLDSGVDLPELLSKRDFLNILSRDLEWIFLNDDLGVSSDFRFALPSSAIERIIAAKLSSLPMCNGVYPPVGALIVPVSDGVIEAVTCKVAELERLAMQDSQIKESIGWLGRSFSDPAGIGPDGKLRWSFMFEDNLYAFFPRTDEDDAFYQQEFFELGICFERSPAFGFDPDIDWIQKMKLAAADR